MGQHFCVCLGNELVSLLFKLEPEGGIILNDAVVDQSHLARAVEMRVSILLSHLTMSGPAGVADTGGATKWILTDGTAEILYPTYLLANGNAAFI